MRQTGGRYRLPKLYLGVGLGAGFRGTREARLPAFPETMHGALRLPAFLPDATRGVVKGLDAADLKASGVDGLVVNTLNLSTKPGIRVISSMGGIHEFMDWRGPVLSDSGGFQVFSLAAGGLASVSNKGLRYRLSHGARRRMLTPEKSIRKQLQMGSDILVCLDHCTHPAAPVDCSRWGSTATASGDGR